MKGYTKMKLFKLIAVVVISLFIAVFMWFLLTPNTNLLGWSWIDEYPSSIIGYHFKENGCEFEIRYMKDWENLIQAQEVRQIPYLNDLEACKKAFDYLTQQEMYLSVGAQVNGDGTWKIVLDHGGEVFDFKDNYKNLMYARRSLNAQNFE